MYFVYNCPSQLSNLFHLKVSFPKDMFFLHLKYLALIVFFVLFFYNYNVLKASFQVSLVNIEINCFFRNKKTLTQRNNSLFLL